MKPKKATKTERKGNKLTGSQLPKLALQRATPAPLTGDGDTSARRQA
ncbi:MAG TPA: hypothetical protein VMG63_17775 [Terriglobia bacterium]|nr:hypothetical protein [Terriglobia bacterium]